MDNPDGTWEAGDMEPLQAEKWYLGKERITRFYFGESSATTKEVPVMGMEEQAQALVKIQIGTGQSNISQDNRSCWTRYVIFYKTGAYLAVFSFVRLWS